jgi:hypothetical protein
MIYSTKETMKLYGDCSGNHHYQKTKPPARAGAKTHHNHYVFDLGLRQCPMNGNVKGDDAIWGDK